MSEVASAYLHNRDQAIPIIKRIVEILMSGGGRKHTELEMDPFKTLAADHRKSGRHIVQAAERQALQEYGIDSEHSAYVVGEIKDIYHDDPETMVHSGSIRRLFDDYREQLNFLYVYILEAHPVDGWGMGSYYSTFKDATRIEERMDAARSLIDTDKEYKTFSVDVKGHDRIPIVVDNMKNDFNRTYSAQPSRIFVVKGGKFAYMGETINELLRASQRKLPSETVRDWLDEYLNY